MSGSLTLVRSRPVRCDGVLCLLPSLPRCLALHQDSAHSKHKAQLSCVYFIQRQGESSLADHQTCDQKVAGSIPGRSCRRKFSSGVSFLRRLLFWYLFNPRVAALTHWRPCSFCQNCRWQVTANHTYILDPKNQCMLTMPSKHRLRTH